MSKADYYRRLASECATMAQRTDDTTSRAVLLHMAEVWIKLAREDEPTVQQRQQIRPQPARQE
jgi:hypothetical protein